MNEPHTLTPADDDDWELNMRWTQLNLRRRHDLAALTHIVTVKTMSALNLRIDHIWIEYIDNV